MVRGDVSNGVAAGLDGMHLDLGQCIENIGQIHQLRPVELNILSGGEVAVAFIPPVGDVGECEHLSTIQRPVRNRNAKHISVQLQINSIHQT